MLNHDLPGVIFVGVNNDGGCTNLNITDRTLLTLSNMRSDGNILPLPTMDVQKRTVGGCDLVAVIVHPSDAPPVRYKGRVWIRVGPRRAIATLEEERRLTEKRRARDLPFDLRPFPSATVGDLDLDLFCRVYLPSEQPVDVIDQNERSPQQQLSSVRFVTPQPEFVPTALGLLVVGKRPLDFIPGHYVQFLRIDGTELTDPIKDEKEISGPLPELLRILEEILGAHISVAVDYSSGRNPNPGLSYRRAPANCTKRCHASNV
jgi:ATP-dependent DNA helicase RecG